MGKWGNTFENYRVNLSPSSKVNMVPKLQEYRVCFGLQSNPNYYPKHLDYYLGNNPPDNHM